MVSLTNSKDIIANSISVIDKDKVIDLKELFLSNLDAINNIVGLPVATLDSLQKLAEAINSDANFFNNIMAAINLKSDMLIHKLMIYLGNFLNYDTIDASTIKFNSKSNVTYVDTSCQAIISIFQYYEITLGTDIKLFDKSDKHDTYPKAEVNVALSILLAGIDRRVQINTVDIDGKFKINAVSNDILKIQKVDGSTLYDAFELSFNNVDKTSILKLIMLIY